MTRTRELALQVLMIIGRGFGMSAIAFGAAVHPGLLWPPQQTERLRRQAGEPR